MTSSYHMVVDHVLSFHGYDCRWYIGRKELVIFATGEEFNYWFEIGSVQIELIFRNHQSAIEMVDTVIGMHRAFGL